MYCNRLTSVAAMLGQVPAVRAPRRRRCQQRLQRRGAHAVSPCAVSRAPSVLAILPPIQGTGTRLHSYRHHRDTRSLLTYCQSPYISLNILSTVKDQVATCVTKTYGTYSPGCSQGVITNGSDITVVISVDYIT